VDARRFAIGWVGHESSSYRELTARENIALVADLHGIAPSAVSVALDRVGATSFAEAKVGTLSRGQKQRVALARGIVHSPDLLLLDEPFTGLDAKGCETLEGVLRDERDRGSILLVVSHDRTLTARIAGQRLLIERGRARLGL
jgi:ABC-type multidrug transport system ATPase subunit